MSEREQQPTSPELQKKNPEKFLGSVEQRPSPENRPEADKEQARIEATQEALSTQEQSTKKEKISDSEEKYITRQDSYKDTMKQVRNNLTPSQRVFSQLIHYPVVEKTSEVIGSTIARPNAILSGSIFAFIATLAIYAIARYQGFSLSGFETIGAFIAGWIVGILFDFFRAMITGKNS